MELKTIKLDDGKDYVQVFERVKAFRVLHPNWTIETHILGNEGGVVTMQATVKDETGRVLATGHAAEKQGSTRINATSHVENCETSAVGRALAMLGIGIETAIASAEEVAAARADQPQAEGTPATPPTLDTVLDRKARMKALLGLIAQLTPDQKAEFRAKYPDGTKGLRDAGLNRLEKELREAIAQQLPKAA